MINYRKIAPLGVSAILIGLVSTTPLYAANVTSGNASSNNITTNTGTRTTARGTMANNTTSNRGAGLGTTSSGWSSQEQYWRDNYNSRPYYRQGMDYNDYQPAYRYGTEAYNQYNGRRFEDIESDLRADWNNSRGSSALSWDVARDATRDAYNRMGTLNTSTNTNTVQ